ncbi:MAG: FtsX-like permease family protein [Acutalibacteraceae bacterium]|jgi:putative ABC transport system permease protein
MSKALFKDVFRSIIRTRNRFLSIAAIVALGISVFAGIKATAPNLKDTAEKYFYDYNLSDISIVSTIGLSENDIYKISKVSGVEAVMPVKSADVFIEVDGKKVIDIEGAQYVCRATSLNMDMATAFQNGVNDAAYMNRPDLLEGAYPKQENECLIDSSAVTSTHKFAIGETVTLTGDNENLKNKLKNTQFTIVGIVRTPMYISVERGNTLIGSGKLGNFIFIPETNFVTDYYTHAFISVAGAFGYKAFSPEYKAYVEPVIKDLEAISEDRVRARAMSLSIELAPQVERGETELAAKEIEAEQKLAEARELVKQIKYYAENGDEELAAKKEEFESSLSDAQRRLLSGRSEYNAGLAEYNRKLAEYRAAKAIADQYPNARADYARAKYDLEEAKKDLDEAENALNETRRLLDQAGEEGNLSNYVVVAQAVARVLAGRAGESISPETLEQLQQAINEENAQQVYFILEGAQRALESELNKAKYEYQVKEMQLEAAAQDIKKLDELEAAEKKLREAELKLNAGSSELSIGELTLNMRQMELKYELTLAEEKLAQAKAKAKTADEEYAKKEAEVRQQLQNARHDIDNAKKVLASLDSAAWSVDGRDALPGHVEYDQSADNMTAFSAVFPVFFFFIAAVVSLTTMTRMVEEERVQLGTLKALGYTSGAIAAKYLIYATLATLIGTVLGLAIGFVLFPVSIYNAYSIMFTTPKIILAFRTRYALIGLILFLAAVSSGAILACRSALADNPSKLMRPKAPKKGKRVFLERIGFIWKRMSFNTKVTARNLLRNKRRFIMTLVGISGCTALLLTGLGIKDSISSISKNQFSGENAVAKYDAQIVLNDRNVSGISPEETLAGVKEDVRVKDAILTHMRTLNGSSEREPDTVLPVSILVPGNTEDLQNFIKLQNRKTGEAYTLNSEGVLVSEKFAAKTKTNPGDEIFVTLNDGSNVNMKVAGVVENYAFHYIYMTKELYTQTFGEEPVFDFITAKLSDNIKSMDETERNAEKTKLATDLAKRDDISVVVYTDQAVNTFNKLLKGLDALVFIFVGSAGALAFVVLYNLSNININERLRELATIKVLGFYDREVASYVFRENILLTALGVASGILIGIPLHKFVINIAEVNIVMFGRSISWLSMVIATSVTVVFAIIVNALMRQKLKKISMVESLKSVE